MFRKPGKTAPDAPAPFCLELAPTDLGAATLESGLTGRADRFYRAGHRLMMRGFYAESAQAFDHATRHDRSHYDAYVGLAEARVLAGSVPQASEALERAMERFGLNCALGAARGHLYLHQQDPDKALECASIANQRDPEYAYAWLVAGEARLALGGRARTHAAECFEKAMTAEVAWPNLKLRIALAHLEWGDAQGAGDLLRHLLDEEPELPLGWILAGDAARLSGERIRAEECYRRACELAPELVWLRQWMGWRGRVREAWRALHRRAARFITSDGSVGSV